MGTTKRHRAARGKNNEHAERTKIYTEYKENTTSKSDGSKFTAKKTYKQDTCLLCVVWSGAARTPGGTSRCTGCFGNLRPELRQGSVELFGPRPCRAACAPGVVMVQCLFIRCQLPLCDVQPPPPPPPRDARESEQGGALCSFVGFSMVCSTARRAATRCRPWDGAVLQTEAAYGTEVAEKEER